MSQDTTNCLGFAFAVSNLPKSFEDLIEFGKSKGVAENDLLEKVVGFFIAHNVNDEGRDIVVEALQSELNIPIKTKTVTLKDGTTDEVPDESSGVYVRRALAESGRTVESLQHLFTDKVLEFNVGGQRKAGGGGKTAKIYLTQAEAVISTGKVDDVIALLTKAKPDLVVGRTENGDVTVESLAKALKEVKDYQNAQFAASLGLSPAA